MMGVEAAVSSNDFLNFIIYETISAANPYFSTQHDHQSNHFNSLVEETLRVFPPPPLPLPLPLPHPQEIENFCGNHSFKNTRIPHPQEIENFCGNHSFNNTRSSSTTSSSSAVLLRRLNSKNIGGGSGGGGSGGGGKKKRRRKARVCKNKQEAETQRMTHIAVERNRRKQMNEHLAVLRSLMPDSYAQRCDQASIVGGAIEFVKEQEHLLQSLEAKKFQLLHGLVSTSSGGNHDHDHQSSSSSNDDDNNKLMMMMDIPEPEPKPKPDSMMKAPFAHFFVYPQYTWCQSPNPMNKMYQGGGKSSSTRASIADIEVTLIETHANVRIMTRISRNQATTTRQLSRLVAGFQALHLTILHVNLTTIAPLLVLYSISAKLEEGCQLTSVDDIAGAVHHMIGIIIEEDDICPAGFI